MKTNKKIVTLAEKFNNGEITDQKTFWKLTKRWHVSEKNAFWELVAEGEKVRELMEFGGEVMNYLDKKGLIDFGSLADGFIDMCEAETDVGLTTYTYDIIAGCADYLLECSSDEEAQRLDEQFMKANTTWYFGDVFGYCVSQHDFENETDYVGRVVQALRG